MVQNYSFVSFLILFHHEQHLFGFDPQDICFCTEDLKMKSFIIVS